MKKLESVLFLMLDNIFTPVCLFLAMVNVLGIMPLSGWQIFSPLLAFWSICILIGTYEFLLFQYKSWKHNRMMKRLYKAIKDDEKNPGKQILVKEVRRILKSNKNDH